jgi:predicted 3-demethylubiquinone-9 3-methyltransferase (glyoxalase superfamily)
MPKITPFLWFNDEAEEAMKFYVSLFKGSKILNVSRLEGAPGQPPGKATTVTARIADQEVTALNGGPQFTFNESFSFVVDCENQAEVDELWQKLTANGGEESQCGWLKDRYGLSWQIVPRRLMELLQDKDAGRARRAMDAMLKMRKIDVATLERAAAAA